MEAHTDIHATALSIVVVFFFLSTLEATCPGAQCWPSSSSDPVSLSFSLYAHADFSLNFYFSFNLTCVCVCGYTALAWLLLLWLLQLLLLQQQLLRLFPLISLLVVVSSYFQRTSSDRISS